MKIAVIGIGRVGSALGLGWAKSGHEVVFGAREPGSDEAKQLSRHTNVQVATVSEAAKAAEIVSLVVPWAAVEDVLGGIASSLKGKLLIDCTNPTGASWPKMDHSAGSGGQQVAELAPEAKVVKCFNSTGFENMENPRYPDGVVTMFYAGDDADAKKIVHQLTTDLGFDAVDAGGLAQSHLLEILASMWGTLAYAQKMGRGIGFRLLRR